MEFTSVKSRATTARKSVVRCRRVLAETLFSRWSLDLNQVRSCFPRVFVRTFGHFNIQLRRYDLLDKQLSGLVWSFFFVSSLDKRGCTFEAHLGGCPYTHAMQTARDAEFCSFYFYTMYDPECRQCDNPSRVYFRVLCVLPTSHVHARISAFRGQYVLEHGTGDGQRRAVCEPRGMS